MTSPHKYEAILHEAKICLANCNYCVNLDYNEAEQHKRGIASVPLHKCKYYNTQVLHGGQHRNVCDCIIPCEQCVNEEYKQFRRTSCYDEVSKMWGEHVF